MSDVLEVFSGDVQTAKVPGLGLVDFVRWQTVIDKWPQPQPAIPPDLKDDIGLCAAAVMLAYYRKTHDHILQDDDTRNAALRVEKWLGWR